MKKLGICLLVLFIFEAEGARAELSMPQGVITKACDTVSFPSVSDDAEKLQPIGLVTDPILGDAVSAKIMLPKMSEDADVYLVISLGDNFFYFSPYDERIAYGSAYRPWRRLNKGEALNEIVAVAEAYASLPASDNYLYLAVSPKNDQSSYYVWNMKIPNVPQRCYTTTELGLSLDYPAEGTAVTGKIDVAGKVEIHLGFGPIDNPMRLIELFVNGKLVDSISDHFFKSNTFFTVDAEAAPFRNGANTLTVRLWHACGKYQEATRTVYKDSLLLEKQANDYLDYCCSILASNGPEHIYWENLPNIYVESYLYDNPYWREEIIKARNTLVERLGIPLKIYRSNSRVNAQLGKSGDIFIQMANNPDFEHKALAYMNLIGNRFKSCVIEFQDPGEIEKWMCTHEIIHCYGHWDIVEEVLMNTKLPNTVFDALMVGALRHSIFNANSACISEQRSSALAKGKSEPAPNTFILKD